MDAQRFDNLAKGLAARLSRRGALRRAGAGAAAGLLASAGMRPLPSSAQGGGEPVYTVIRRYTLDGGADDVRAALQRGYLADACNAPGFVAYFAVEDEDGDFATVAVFRSQQDFDNFANAEANWIAQNLADLLPAPDEAISGQTYVHVGRREAFRNTCEGGSAPTQAPAPTAAPPTAAPAQPTPQPQPACTGQGCVCTTGTQSPCDDGLICCPTTDTMGGPGVCQTEDVCYPNQCVGNGNACAATCNWGDACPSCCSNFCNSGGQCDDLPQGCTGAGCGCTTGTQNPCDPGLICCGPNGVPGGPGVCTAQTDCGTPCTGANCACDPNNANSCDQGLTCCAVQSGYICIDSAQCGPAPCTGEGCDCDFNDPNACDQGLVCCAVQSGFICATQADCGGAPCTGEGCECSGGVQGACDPGLVCCLNGVPVIGGNGGCVPEEQCPASTACTSQGCDCIGGTQGACDDGLICCVQGDPGAPGTCQTEDACPASLCTGEACDCTLGTQSPCRDDLICCGSGGPGAPGTCQNPSYCPNGCGDTGATCDGPCTPGDTNCAICCSGWCNNDGVCDAAQ
jgi:hypothetical protein